MGIKADELLDKMTDLKNSKEHDNLHIYSLVPATRQIMKLKETQPNLPEMNGWYVAINL